MNPVEDVKKKKGAAAFFPLYLNAKIRVSTSHKQ
jgi:hypothetical protein